MSSKNNNNNQGNKKDNNKQNKASTSKISVDSMKNEKKSIKIQTSDIYTSNNIESQKKNYINSSNVQPAKKEVSSGEAIDKMLSMGKSFFTNGMSFIGTATIFVCGAIFVTGYDPIPIIEKRFIYTSDGNESKSDIITELPGLDISKDMTPEDLFTTLYDFVSLDLGGALLNTSLFHEGRESFNAQMGMFYSDEYSKQLESNDVLYNTLQSIYETEGRYPYSVTLTSIGKVVKGSTALDKVSIDINAVDDDSGFHVWNVALFLNSSGQIEDVKVLAENKTLKNTRTPLDPSTALITNGVKDSASRSVNTFFKGMNNEGLYNKSTASTMPINQAQFKAFFSKLNLQEKNYEILTEMFKLSNGNSSNFAITEIINTDFDGEPITNFILSIKVGEDVYKYNLEYNRRDKTLLGISNL